MGAAVESCFFTPKQIPLFMLHLQINISPSLSPHSPTSTSRRHQRRRRRPLIPIIETTFSWSKSYFAPQKAIRPRAIFLTMDTLVSLQLKSKDVRLMSLFLMESRFDSIFILLSFYFIQAFAQELRTMGNLFRQNQSPCPFDATNHV